VSDIAGQDPVPHKDSPDQLVVAIRNWLQTVRPKWRLPGGHVYANYFQDFMRQRHELAKTALLEVGKLTFLDQVRLIEDWLEVNTI